MVKILIADDSKFMRMLIVRLLSSCGIKNIIEASTGEEVLEKCKQHKQLHLIFLDINMPGLNGLQTLREIKKVNPSAKVVIVSAISQKDAVKEALQSGAEEYITKPFSQENILKIVKRFLAQ